MKHEPSKQELLQAAGRQAAAQQPDEIHLTAAPSHAWSNASAVDSYATNVRGLGFVEAGSYTIDALPVAVRFLLKEAERMYATIYEHPKAGVWMNFVILYENGTSSTLTTTPNRGLEQRPGHPIVHSPGASPEQLYALAARHGRRIEERKPLSQASIVAEFERSWKDGVAWRKSRGFTTVEVASILLTRDGKPSRVLRAKRIQFIADEDGPPERGLKEGLATVFEQHPSLERAYLVRVRYDESPNVAVALCLVGASASNTTLVEDVRRTFLERFPGGSHLDLMFVPSVDQPRLDAASRPFYTRG
jgi:hypothetical protein